jgi:GNAT superfamily N-acetyltransferase
MSVDKNVIRKGVKEDLSVVLALIKELANYEKSLDQVAATVKTMERDGFGDQPIYGFYVAESDSVIIGVALYYYRYSTWKGKRLYLEDLVVTESSRGTGAGKLLFDQMIIHGKASNCTGMMWQVLDWNDTAINFYKKNEANLDDGWLNCHLDW